MNTERRQYLYLDTQMKQKSNNLDFMKFLAAWLVIVHHSFDLNVSKGEWIKVITGQQLDFGTVAVSLFFLASGLFIAKSMERNQSAGKFFRARFRRVWPPLAAVVVLSVIMGAFVTTLPLGQYFTNSVTWRYLLNAVFVLRHNLPGVFENNVFGSAVNGALWTLPVEVLCYVGCYVIYRLGLLKKKRILGVMAVYLVCALIGFRICSMLGIVILSAAFRPIYFFLLGHVLYVYRDRVPVCLCSHWWAWQYALRCPGRRRLSGSFIRMCFFIRHLWRDSVAADLPLGDVFHIRSICVPSRSSSF